MQNPRATHIAGGPGAPAPDDFVRLATPVLELVLRLRAGLETPSDDFRQVVETKLKQMDEEGAAGRYRETQLRNVKFALVTFVDETVLLQRFPLHTQWQKRPLQLQYFNRNDGGEEFFHRLEQLLGDVEAEAGVIEVYYLCLLLGFEGEPPAADGLKGVIARTADALRGVGRLEAGELSPHWEVTDQPEIPPRPGIPKWLKVGAGVGVGLLVLTFIILTLVLNSNLSQAKDSLLR